MAAPTEMLPWYILLPVLDYFMPTLPGSHGRSPRDDDSDMAAGELHGCCVLAPRDVIDRNAWQRDGSAPANHPNRAHTLPTKCAAVWQ
jgi:hypothetical protein